MCGVDMQSQLACDLAIKGPIRPINSKLPILYGIKCIDFDPPSFTIGKISKIILNANTHQNNYKLLL